MLITSKSKIIKNKRFEQTTGIRHSQENTVSNKHNKEEAVPVKKKL